MTFHLNNAVCLTNGKFTLTLSNPVYIATTVSYSIGGTATAGTDYTALSGSVVIPAYTTSQSITVVRRKIEILGVGWEYKRLF
jgi:hypothetical protein